MESLNNYKTPDAVCDLIMKGGITSGVIYPKLIGKLAEKYRLKNIGGTSAGAIAAAGAAAAEFRRYTQNTDAGFTELKRLPEYLGENIGIEECNRSRLLSLFQPTPNLKRHFTVLLNALNVSLPGLAALETVFQMVYLFPLPLVLGLAVGTLLLWSTFLGLTTGNSLLSFYGALAVNWGWIVGTLGIRCWFRGKINSNKALRRTIEIWFILGIVWIAVVAWFLNTTPTLVFSLEVGSLALESFLIGFVALIAISVSFTRSMVRGLAENGYGFCSGLNAGGSSEPEALTNWLTGYFNELAGLSKSDRPLTFGDLWRGSREQEPKTRGVKNRVINLEVMTSAVSRKMPYRIPFTRDEMEYYFDPVEWRQLFPKVVIDLMKVNGASKIVYDRNAPNRSLYLLPKAETWPIVVAVRMSLSFPLLLSAVPLYARDWTLKSVIKEKNNKEAIRVSKVWFSDGGISSNMPLHFFDAILPQHPTFAINLTEKRPDVGDGNLKTPPLPGFEEWRIRLASGNDQGLDRHWKSPSEIGIAGLFGFLLSVIETMQNWRDEILFPYPGYRDRIVQISQSTDEGGLNLNMPGKVIKALGNAGENAAEQLIARFIDNDGWDNHRKIRLRNLLAQLDLKLDDLDLKEIESWQRLLDEKALAKPYKMDENEKKLAVETLAALVEMARKLQSALPVTLAGSHAPRPFAEIRITPRY